MLQKVLEGRNIAACWKVKLKSRAYINNFQDKGKQASIDMLLVYASSAQRYMADNQGMMAGQRPVILFDPISDSVQSALNSR